MTAPRKSRATPSGVSPPAELIDALVILVLLLAVSYLLARAPLTSSVGSYLHGGVGMLHRAVTGFMGSTVPLALAVVIYPRSRLRKDLGSLGFRGTRLPADLLWALGGYVVYVGIGVAGLLLLAAIFGGVAPGRGPGLALDLQGIGECRGTGEFVLSLALLGLLAPLVEEVYFRGILYKALRSRFGVFPGILVSSVTFALLHAGSNDSGFPAFVLGAIAAGSYEARGSLVPAVILHGLSNNIAIGVACFLGLT